MTKEIDDAELDAAVRLMEDLCATAVKPVVCYNWDESGHLALVTPVNLQKEAT
jgi:hypothetical protein